MFQMEQIKGAIKFRNQEVAKQEAELKKSKEERKV
jgi:hypothetical protein